MDSNTHELKPELIYSMAELESVIKPLLDLLQPRSVCEIGVEKGRFTEFLLAFCRNGHCSYTGVDVMTEAQVVPLGNGKEATYIKGRSLDVLPELPVQDTYFIDGDHNYYTVLNELRLVAKGPERHSLILLHDVGWPWGRRDIYYQPESIPAEYRHPCRAGGGPVPGQLALEEWGLGSKYGDLSFAAAESEGGPRNGVLTAVEDFLQERGGAGWRLLVVPAVFGLGILYKPETCPPPVLSFLQQLASSVAQLGGVLGKVEENRVQLFVLFLKGFQHGEALTAKYQELQGAYGALKKHAADLLEAYRDLRSHMDRVVEDNQRLRGGR